MAVSECDRVGAVVRALREAGRELSVDAIADRLGWGAGLTVEALKAARASRRVYSRTVVVDHKCCNRWGRPTAAILHDYSA